MNEFDDCRDACRSNLSEICIEGLLPSLTSAPNSGMSGMTALNDMGKSKKSPVTINLVIQCERDLEKINVSNFSMGLKVGAELALDTLI